MFDILCYVVSMLLVLQRPAFCYLRVVCWEFVAGSLVFYTTQYIYVECYILLFCYCSRGVGQRTCGGGGGVPLMIFKVSLGGLLCGATSVI